MRYWLIYAFLFISIPGFTQSAPSNAFDVSYTAGADHYTQKRYPDAKKSFEEAASHAVKLYGHDSYEHRNALWYLVYVNIALDDDKALKKAYETLLRIKVEENAESIKGLTELAEMVGDHYGKKLMYADALPHYKRAIRLHQQNNSMKVGENFYWDAKNLIEYSFQVGKKDSAHYYYELMLDNVPATDHRYARALRDWVDFAIAEKSRDVFNRIEKRSEDYLRAKEEKNERDQWYAEIWYYYGTIQKAKGQNERAINAFSESKKVIMALVNADTYDQLLKVLSAAVETINQSKKFDKTTDSWATELEQHNEKLLATRPKAYCENLVPVYMYYFYSRQYKKAETLIEKFMPIYGKEVGADNPDYRMMQLAYRGVLEKTGNTEKLKSLGEVKLTEAETIQSLDLRNAPTEIAQLGAYMQKGDYLNAIALFEKREKVFSGYFASINDYNTYILTVLTIASVYRELGNMKKSGEMLTEAEAIAEQKLPKGNFNRINAMTAHGVFYQQVGDYVQAEKKFLDAMNDLNDTRNGADSLENDKVYYETLSFLGSLYAKWGYYKDAEKALLDVLSFQRKDHKEDSWEVVNARIDVADLYRVMQYFSWAEMLYKECEGPMKKIHGENNIKYITFQQSFAANYQLRGKYREAEPGYVKARDFFLANLGSRSERYIAAVTDLAMMYFHLGDYAKAKEHYKILNEVLLYKTDNFFPALSEKEKANFYASSAQSLNTYNSFAVDYARSSPAEVNEMYDLQLVTKGMLFKATNKMRQTVINSKDDSLKTLYTRWINSKNDLARIYQMSGPQKQAAGINEKQLETSVNALEKKISTRSELFTNIVSRRATWKNIKDNLKPGEAAVEIVRIKNARAAYVFAFIGKGVIFDTLGNGGYMRVTEIPSDRCPATRAGIREWDIITSINGVTTKGKTSNQLSDLMATSPTRIVGKHSDGKDYSIDIKSDSVFRREFVRKISYAALIITPEEANAQLVVLPNGDQLESRYVKYYNNMIKTQSVDQYSYQQFWAPIKNKLGKSNRVFLSPDGVYNSINLNTLYNPETGKYLIDESEIIIVGNTSDILNQRRPASSRTAVLVGYPDYYLKGISQSTQAASSDTTYNILAKDTTQRFMSGSTITELPGTNVEVTSIESVMKPLKYDVKKYVIAEATEERLKSVASPTVLHIATHGFFLNEIGNDGDDETRGFTGITDRKLKENPLLRSGLLLAGSGKTIAGQRNPNAEDGILTAYEAMNLDLNSTELVVMSACETGLGEIKSGEGVYGLQRAFRSAGAQSVLMSLWKVDDRATQELMSGFYKQWLTSGNKQTSFRDAQLKIRERFKHPYYWGAFVMVGQ